MAQLKDLLVDGKSRFIDKIYANDQFISKVAQGTSPFLVDSSTLVTNLNADLLDGHHYKDFSLTSHSHTWVGDGTNKLYAELNNEINFGGTNTGTTMYFSYRAKDSRPIITSFVFGGSNGSATLKAKQFISSATQGTPPIKTDSSTLVTNLNADYLDGFHAADFRNNIIDLRAQYDTYNPTYLKDVVKVDENDYYQLLAGNDITKNGVTHTYNSSNLYLVDKINDNVPQADYANYAEYAKYARNAGTITVLAGSGTDSTPPNTAWHAITYTPPYFNTQSILYANHGFMVEASKHILYLGDGAHGDDNYNHPMEHNDYLKQYSIYLKNCNYYISGEDDALSFYSDSWMDFTSADGEFYFNGIIYADYVSASQKIGIGVWPSEKFNLYNGKAAIQGPSSGNTSILPELNALILAPKPARSSTSNTYYPGIAFNHMYKYNSNGTYDNTAHAWIGERLHSTPTAELGYLVFATKPGSGTTYTGNNIPLERMCIAPSGEVGIGVLAPSQKLQVGGTIYSSAAQGTAPLKVDSSTLVSNLNVDFVDDHHGMSAGSLLYKYSVTGTIAASSVTGDFWYATVSFTRSYVRELTKTMLDATYSNVQGQVYLDTYTYNGYWYAFATDYNGSNIKGIALKSQNNPIYYIKLAKPVAYNGTTPDGTITVYSTYNCTITVSATAPSGVTFTDIPAGKFTNVPITATPAAHTHYIGTTPTQNTSTAGQDLTGIGTVYIKGNGNSWTEGIRIKPNNSWATILLGGNDLTADTGTSANSWSIHNYNGSFYIAKNGSGATGTNTALFQNVSNNWNFAKGNVGIGTAPSTKLHVKSDSNTSSATQVSIENATFAQTTYCRAVDATAAAMVKDSRMVYMIGKAGSNSNKAYFGYHHIADGCTNNFATIGLHTHDELLNVLANGNVGIGTTAPSQKLHVTGTIYSSVAQGTAPLKVDSSTLVSNLNVDYLDNKHATDFYWLGRNLNHVDASTSWNGVLPINAFAFRHGKPAFDDPDFKTSIAGVSYYGRGQSQGAVTRMTDASAAAADSAYVPSGNSSGYVVKITDTSVTANNIGGFVQTVTAGKNKVWVQVFRAFLPVGATLNPAANSMGTGSKQTWLTSNAGTGKWEWYALLSINGNGGSYSTFGHISAFLTGGTTSNVWYLSYCNSYELTNGEYDGLRTKFADTATNADNATNATNASNADTVDNEHAAAFAHRQTWNNMVHSGNEYTWIAPGYTGGIWINYRTASGTTDGSINEYIFGTGKGTQLAKISLNTFHGNITGNAATISTITRSTNASHYLTFVDSDNSNSAAENLYTSSKIVFNPSNGFLGLGTTSPTTTLHVIGSIYADSTPTSNASKTQYISAGPGYSTAAGKYGVKVVSCDQSDTQTGLGQDLGMVSGWSGWENSYNLSIAGGNNSSDVGKISFVSHKVNSTSYRYLGGFLDTAGTIKFNVQGTGLFTGSVGIGTNAPENALDVNGISSIYPRGADNTLFKGSLIIKQQHSLEGSNGDWDETKPSYGIQFNRFWTSGSSPYGETACAGIFATVSSSWRGGLVFRTKNNTTNGGTHDISALTLMPSGIAKFVNTIVSKVAQGTAPIQVDSSTVSPNLNADYLDGVHAYELRSQPKNNSYIIFSSLPFLESGIGMFSSTPAVSMENAPEGLCYGPITSYKQYTSDFITVEPGETVYGEIWAYRASGATGTAGTLYYGIQRYDRNKKPISANAGLNAPNNGYFVCSGTTVPADGTWHKYSNTHTIPTSHTVYSGSDGKGVYYVKVYVLVNYSSGTIPTYIGRFLLSRTVKTAETASSATSSSKVKTVACTSTGNHYLTFVDSNNSTAAEETVYTTSKTVIQPSTGNLITEGYVAMGTGRANSYIGSDAANNIWLHNSSGYAVVCDANVVRRGASLTTGQLGSSTYPWASVYGTSIYTRYVNIDSSTAGNTAHIQFNRASYNYIQLPTGGTLSVNINGAGSANSYFKIDSTGVYPGDKDASYNLGSASLRWKDFYTAKANVRQTASAALGIATSTPYKIGTAKKDINIETIANGSGTGINDGYAAGLTFGDTTAAYAGIYYQTSGSYGSRLIFATTSSYANGSYGRVIISNSGYVGIGTMSPSQLLHVAGTIYSSVAQGTAPLKVDSSTLVANLHSEFTDYASVLRDPTYHTSGSRRTSANITFADGGLHYYLATSSMTAANGKPASDGGILHMAWDNSKWDMQLFVPDNPNYGMQWRCQTNGTDASWCPWHTIYDSSNLIPTSLTLSTSDQAFITANGTAYNIKLPATIPWTVSTTDVKVTQTKTTSSNTSWRPLILGLSYSDAATFAPDTCTGTTYATHLAKFKPSTGVLAVVGLKKMKTDGTEDTGSDTNCFNTNGGVTTVITSHQTIKQNGITGATRNCYASCTTAAGTAAKTASVTSGTVNLEAGLKVSVKFSNKNTANNPTLNINSKGAKNIFHNGAQITSGTNKGMLYGVVDFVYDGTQWCLVGNYVDTDNNNFNDNVKTKAIDSSNATYYITFVDSNNSTATAENVYTSSFLMHNPSLKSFSAGYNNSVTGSYSSALGENITVNKPWSFGHGYNLRIDSSYSHAEGYQTRAMGSSSHAEGMSGNLNTTTVDSSTLAQIRTAHATSGFSLAKGEASHCEGFNTVAFGNNSHAEGQGCITGGAGSHAEGYTCVAIGNYSHVEGCRNYAEGEYSHAEGTDSSAIGNYAHAEGNGTYAGGAASHAEGSGTVVYSTGSHAGGWHTTIGTNASYVFAHGNNIKAQDASYYQGCGVFGCYNNDTASQMRYFFVVGNGTSDSNRSNILEIGYDTRNSMIFGGTIDAKSYRTVPGSDTVTGNSKTLAVGVEHNGNLVELTASGTSTTVALTIQWPNPISGESCHIIIYNSSSVKKTINIGNVVNQSNNAFTTRKNTSSISIPASGFGEISIIYLASSMYVRSVGN